MSLPDSAQVLIVGGGPTGIVLALALQKHGCKEVVVVDALVQGENTSRALAVHAPTIEAFEEIGVAEQLVNAGGKISRTSVWMGRDVPRIETAYFTPLAKYTKYPFILAIPQHVTEKILAAAAQERGVTIFRPHKVVDMKPSEGDPTLTDVIFEDGHVLRTRCVVGADGARSKVRALANVGWTDPTGEADANSDNANMIVADVTLANPPAPFQPDAINLVVSSDNAMLFAKLPGTPYAEQTTEPTYRMACGIPAAHGAPPRAPDTAYLQNVMDTWGPNVVLPADTPRVEITRTAWSSRFRTHSAIADRFLARVPGAGPEGGLVFLVGDAAHIHPPMGGQGMNLGIRDAVKLAPILSKYIHALSASSPNSYPPASSRDELEAPLRVWAEERHTRALTVIRLVKDLQRMTWIPNKTQWFLGIVPYNPATLRNWFLRFFTSFEWFRANSAWRVSGLGNR